MRPAARYAAAIEILDQIVAGMPAEVALSRWARASRFAGSKDRAALRDIVFDILRKRRSSAARGGGPGGRALVLGALRMLDRDPAEVFGAGGYAPTALAEGEGVALPETHADKLDCPDWLLSHFQDSLGAQTQAVLEALRSRAPVFLRVAQRRATVMEARAELLRDAIETREVADIKNCLQVTENQRRIKNSSAYLNGMVELQDASSQRAIHSLPDLSGRRVLDYCAGGGGKALAMADLGAEVFAYDINPGRMADLPIRAARAGVEIEILDPAALTQSAPFDLVFCDAPCSGSGTWRRNPDEKWRLTPERLAEICVWQREILQTAQGFVGQNGLLAYATCSVLKVENETQISGFLRQFPQWQQQSEQRLLPDAQGDGFTLTMLKAS